MCLVGAPAQWTRPAGRGTERNRQAIAQKPLSGMKCLIGRKNRAMHPSDFSPGCEHWTRMLLSTSHNFIFLHVPKTAGSSLHRVLEPYARTSTRTLWRSFSRRLPVTESPERAHFRIHATAAEIRAELSPAVYDSFLSFAVVRNPFDHAVSHFHPHSPSKSLISLS